MGLSDEGPTLKMLDYAIRIGSTPIFLYFDLYLYIKSCIADIESEVGLLFDHIDTE